MKFKVTIGVAILGLFIVGMAVKQVAEKKIVSIGNEQALSLEEEEKMRIRGFSVENVKELALTAWNVLIFIIWINHTLREQER